MTTVINNWVLLSAYMLTFLIGLPANILALYAFIKKLVDRPTPTDILLLNLTASDIVFLLFLPLKMYEAGSYLQWHLPEILCSITSFVFFTTIYTSSLLLMAVSVDRYLGVAFPIAYRKFRKGLYAIAGSAFIWVFSGFHCTIVFFVVHLGEKNRTRPKTTCYENFTSSQKEIVLPVRLEFFVVLCLVPMLVCAFCYLNCIWILYTRPRITKEKKQRAIGMALGTLTVFLVCFLPYNISHLVGFVSNESPQWRYYTLLLSTFNTCLDPIIFYFSSSTYRNTTKVSFWKLLSFKHFKGRRGNKDPESNSQISNIMDRDKSTDSGCTPSALTLTVQILRTEISTKGSLAEHPDEACQT
ncbi:free fatty acid receptor 2-like [Hoplias malabaricus]|uniref:free fatty acid receptor 2-like n=1 Tax=Hoplias malabaricus TaxID=27720 RepID=UPI0034630C5D